MDRFDFPQNIYRVTAGHGGEAILVAGSEKNALIDCGMAYCGDKLVENIQTAVEKTAAGTLDYVLLTHSHYDHAGALPYIRKVFPDVKVCGNGKCRDILIRPNAIKQIKHLGTVARKMYVPEDKNDILVEGLYVDIVLEDNDEISIGNEKFIAIETKGHTDCSVSYLFEPSGLMFTSESVGFYMPGGEVHIPALKSFEDSFESMLKCRSYGARQLCLSHYGMAPDNDPEIFWNDFTIYFNKLISFVKNMLDKKLSDDEMIECFTDRYWLAKDEQPREAFAINAVHILKSAIKYIENNGEYKTLL